LYRAPRRACPPHQKPLPARSLRCPRSAGVHLSPGQKGKGRAVLKCAVSTRTQFPRSSLPSPSTSSSGFSCAGSWLSFEGSSLSSTISTSASVAASSCLRLYPVLLPIRLPPTTQVHPSLRFISTWLPGARRALSLVPTPTPCHCAPSALERHTVPTHPLVLPCRGPHITRRTWLARCCPRALAQVGSTDDDERRPPRRWSTRTRRSPEVKAAQASGKLAVLFDAGMRTAYAPAPTSSRRSLGAQAVLCAQSTFLTALVDTAGAVGRPWLYGGAGGHRAGPAPHARGSRWDARARLLHLSMKSWASPTISWSRSTFRSQVISEMNSMDV
jgi:hypothetical protein